MGLQCDECGWEWPLAREFEPMLLGPCGAHVGGRAADARSLEILRYQQRREAKCLRPDCDRTAPLQAVRGWCSEHEPRFGDDGDD